MDCDAIAARIVSMAVAPQAAAGCAALRGTSWTLAEGGHTEVLFDLASVTKPMTAVALARAGVDRHTMLGALVPEARDTASERVTLDHLLAHRAGLDPHRDLHAPLLRGETVDVAHALRTAAQARRAGVHGEPSADGFPPLYSDLGYVLAGAALARATGARDAAEAIATLVVAPLGLGKHLGSVRELAAHSVRGPFAPTEYVPWRGGLVRGAVHDENAWALTGAGGSGHAGMFGTAKAVLVFGAALLDALRGQPTALGGCDFTWLVRERPGGTLRAGFDGKSATGSSAGRRFGSGSFGHLGFTGTSLWIDPDARVVATLLTNRVCPRRDHLAIREARPWAHDTLFAHALELRAAAP